MKYFKIFVTYIIAPSATVVSLAYGFDRYVVGRAETAVKPVETRVTSLESIQGRDSAMIRAMAIHLMGAKKVDDITSQEKANNP